MTPLPLLEMYTTGVRRHRPGDGAAAIPQCSSVAAGPASPRAGHHQGGRPGRRPPRRSASPRRSWSSSDARRLIPRPSGAIGAIRKDCAGSRPCCEREQHHRGEGRSVSRPPRAGGHRAGRGRHRGGVLRVGAAPGERTDHSARIAGASRRSPVATPGPTAHLSLDDAVRGATSRRVPRHHPRRDAERRSCPLQRGEDRRSTTTSAPAGVWPNHYLDQPTRSLAA